MLKINNTGKSLTLGLGLGFALAMLTPAARADAPRVPVLVELFTSEGCSSCPPADSLLRSLTERQPVPGVEVIALGEHVDYWNNGRWADRFSTRALTARQSFYADAFRNSTVYTPQMIVDGRAEFNGSDSDLALSAIRRAARTQKAVVNVSIGASSGSSSVPVTVTVPHVPGIASGGEAQVYLAVTEDGLHSNVTGGENSGQRLVHSAVVRLLISLGAASSGQDFHVSRTVSLPGGAGRSSVALVAFVQDTRTGHVLGAGEARL